jgi:hypothetical protein
MLVSSVLAAYSSVVCRATRRDDADSASSRFAVYLPTSSASTARVLLAPVRIAEPQVVGVRHDAKLGVIKERRGFGVVVVERAGARLVAGASRDAGYDRAFRAWGWFDILSKPVIQ